MILVTGGAGFFGSNLVRRLVKKGYKIKVIDDLSYGSTLNLKEIINERNFHFIRGSILNKEKVEQAMDGVDVVVHMAAWTHVDRSILSSNQFTKVDFDGTAMILEQARKNRVKLFIHISTSEVYGTRQTKGPMTEEHPLNPHSPYAASKCGADRLVKSYFITYDFPAVILRFFNLYGPYQYPEKFIPLSITNLLSGKYVPLYGTGNQKRDWVYVEDGVDAILKCIKTKKGIGEEINIATGKSYENLFVLTEILKIANINKNLVKHVKDRPGHVVDLKGSYKKAERILGWKPETNVKEGLAKTVKWYIENKNWWRKRRNERKFKEFYKEWYKQF